MGNEVAGGITVRRIDILHGDIATLKKRDEVREFVAKKLVDHMLRNGEERGIWLRSKGVDQLTYSPSVQVGNELISTWARYKIEPRSDKGRMDVRDQCVISTGSEFSLDYVFMVNFVPSPNLNLLFDDFTRQVHLEMPCPPDKSYGRIKSDRWWKSGGNMVRRRDRIGENWDLRYE